MLCADLVDVQWKDQSGRTRRGVANLEDISLSGACLQVDRPVPHGTILRMSYPNGELSGIVKYCVFREIGYFLGVEFEADGRNGISARSICWTRAGSWAASLDASRWMPRPW